MSKIETFKNEYIEFYMYKASKVNMLYNKKFNSEFENDALDGKLDEEKMLFAVFESYKCASKILEKETNFSIEDFEIKLTSLDLIECFYLIMGVSKKESDDFQKKTIKQRKT